MKAKTGEILGALERGTESVSSTLEHLIYSVVPTIVDIIIAMTYLAWKFGWMYGVIVAIQIGLYLTLTVILIEKRSKHQSSINSAENQLRQSVLESLLNFETVKCFGNEDFEKEKYSRGLRTLQHRQYLICLGTTALQACQLFLIYSGLMACSLLLVSSIIEGREGHDRHHKWTVGDYVLCTSYLGQLYGPLNYLAGYYKTLRVNLIDTESMLEYLEEKPEIVDSHQASALELGGVRWNAVEFRNVSYLGESGEFVLRNVSFSIRPNMKVALVSLSGTRNDSPLQ